MHSPIHAKTEQLINGIIYPFYKIERDMELPIREAPENDAEHSWSLAVAACALAPQIDPSLDVGKIAQYATVHDLVEVYAGDVSIYDINPDQHDNKEDNEAQAMEKLRTDYAHLPWVVETIDEYERKDTPEARYVWAMDKYVAMYMRILYAKPFFHKKGITKEFFDDSMKRVRKKTAAFPAVSLLFDELLAEFDAHPEWFVN